MGGPEGGGPDGLEGPGGGGAVPLPFLVIHAGRVCARPRPAPGAAMMCLEWGRLGSGWANSAGGV